SAIAKLRAPPRVACSDLLGHGFINSLRLSSDVPPIPLANILINLHRQDRAIHAVSASPLRSGNPIIVACLHAIVVRLEAPSLETLKSLTPVVQCAPRLGQRHTANP